MLCRGSRRSITRSKRTRVRLVELLWRWRWRWRCVMPLANAPSKGFGAVISAITQRQPAQVGKPAHAAGSPTYT
ncbi:MAG: hypothetical protein HWQ41_14795 [Nostoc sp. NOS(2021)]|nr:hypothetical protein [Nostoc sp. NOS(2021)]